MRETTNPLNRRTFVTAAGATVLGTGAVGSVRADDSTNMSDEPRIIAHRGYAGVYPENTVRAVERASETAAMIEIDIMPTSDGKIVVFHDNEMSGRDGGEQGLTDVEGCVWENPWETVRKAEVLESGETVPSLAETLDAVPTDVGVNIEFKNPGSTDAIAGAVSGEELDVQKELWRPFAEDALELAEAADNEILVSSFHEAALAVVRDLAPDIPVAFLFSESIDTGLTVTETYDCEALHPSLGLIEGAPFFSGEESDTDLVEWAHERGKAVNVWTVATWYEAERLAAAGVDGLIADYPGLLD